VRPARPQKPVFVSSYVICDVRISYASVSLERPLAKSSFALYAPLTQKSLMREGHVGFDTKNLRLDI
jgi:hypothetical protein